VKEWELRAKSDFKGVWADVKFAAAMDSEQLGKQACRAVSELRAMMQHMPEYHEVQR
jgi:hypothetical protein